MSSLWTPDGERPVDRNNQGGGQAPPPPEGGKRAPTGFESDPQANPEQQNQEQLEELQRQLAATPAEVVVSNHCFGLFELAALHLSQSPPNLSEAQLAIDALGALVENLTGRLGEAEPHLIEGLSQLRMAYVQVKDKSQATGD
jgi:hypothetical protein